jgi:hypothetical protein
MDERRTNDVEIAVLKEKVANHATDISDMKTEIRALSEFKNKALGWALAASFVASVAVQLISNGVK